MLLILHDSSEMNVSPSINSILIRVYPRKRGWPDLPRQQFLNLPFSISLDSWRPFSPNQRSCSPSLLASSTSSLVVLASSCPSPQTPALFSERAHHPSPTHARTFSLHLPLPCEPLFPSNHNTSIRSSVLFFSISFASHIALTIALSVLLKIAVSFSLKHHVALPYNTKKKKTKLVQWAGKTNKQANMFSNPPPPPSYLKYEAK